MSIKSRGDKHTFSLKCDGGDVHLISFWIAGPICLHNHESIKAEAAVRIFEKDAYRPMSACIQWLRDFQDGYIREEAFTREDLDVVSLLYNFRHVRQAERTRKRAEIERLIQKPPSVKGFDQSKGGIYIPKGKTV